jgi:hypothetical protein
VNPYGATAPASDFQVIAAPSSDVTLDPPARTFQVMADGVVSVRTLKGETRTETLTAGVYSCMIDTIFAATAVDILVYQY